MTALLDTSCFVATEPGRPLGEMPGVTDTEVSVATSAEPTLGVPMAHDDARPARVPTLSAVGSSWDPSPVDTEVARQFARMAAVLRADRRRVPILDLLVAATAAAERIPVVTQDRDHDAIPGVEVIRV